jgi:phosphohistidine phosphatase
MTREQGGGPMLLLVRHAIAEARGATMTGTDDAERALTARGAARMGRAATALAAEVPGLRLIAHSGLIRARETAAILAAAWHDTLDLTVLESLAPGGAPADVHAFVARRLDAGPLALVGHEPDLSQLANYFLTGEPRSVWHFKKGGACLLTFDEVADGRAALRWLLTARQLRSLARRRR